MNEKTQNQTYNLEVITVNKTQVYVLDVKTWGIVHYHKNNHV